MTATEVAIVRAPVASSTLGAFRHSPAPFAAISPVSRQGPACDDARMGPIRGAPGAHQPFRTRMKKEAGKLTANCSFSKTGESLRSPAKAALERVLARLVMLVA